MSTDWNSVYRATYEDLVRFLYRKVWDAERAHDLAQETFLRCLRDRAANAQPMGNARAFVFTVANNLARDEARSVIRRKKHLTLLKSEAETATPPVIAEETIEQERKQAAVEAALAQLSDRDREILLLWDAGLTYQDIAAQTGLSIGAIGTTLSRARRRLVEAFETTEGTQNVARG
ncbi:MAG TPA: sigma-70 family RNA polymerase sigma factor [Longimicrobiales bacterium]|nr:sigma-70 family RNA polymerase sigma factor [Longimicrobiales bacterium]